MAIRFLEMCLGIVFLAAGSIMGVIAGLGQTTSTGTSVALSEAMGTTIGNALFLLYAFFFVLQLLLLGKRFLITGVLQMVPVFLHSRMVNFFRYDFPPFQLLSPQTIAQRFAIFLPGMLLISLGFTIVRYSEFTNYPPESFCQLMAKRIGIRFGTVKIALDFVYVATSLLVCHLSGQTPSMVGIGTLLFASCNGVLINLFTPLVKKVLP